MRHGPLLVLLVVAVVGTGALLYSTVWAPQVGPLAVQYVPVGQAAAQPPNTFIISGLEVGEYLGNEYQVIGPDAIPALASSFVTGKETRANLYQQIVLRDTTPGGFDGGFIDFRRTETNDVTDALVFEDTVFELNLEFSPGLESDVESGEAVDLDGVDFPMLGDRYTLVDVKVSGNSVRMRMFGGFGSVEFEDNDVTDDNYQSFGAKVNQQNVDADVKIRATMLGDRIIIYSIRYRLTANAAIGGDIEVRPLTCARQYAQYSMGFLSPNFDFCWKGISGAAAGATHAGISGNEVRFDPRGSERLNLVFTNTRGRLYDVPLVDLDGGIHYGRGTRSTIFKEAANDAAPNIAIGDYFFVTSKDDVSGVTNALRYDNNDGNVAYFEDLAGDIRKATFDAGTGEGQLLIGDGTYRFVVDLGTNEIAMDQDNDGSISGDEAKIIVASGSKIDLSAGFSGEVITPRRLFDDATSDEKTDFSIFDDGGDIGIMVPSPQTTITGYEFKLISEGGGVKSGLTKYGILFTYEDNGGQADELRLIVPGRYAGPTKGGALGEVYITLERPRLMKPTQLPPAQCGNSVKEAGEYCDPPGSFCAGPGPFDRGTCSTDCATCVPKPRATCGNNLIEQGEQCEKSVDCGPGYACDSCQCVAAPPVCGNNLIEPPEQCEKDIDCAQGMMCSNCGCVPAPVVETPAPVKLNIFARFFSWLASLFGA